MTEYHRESGSRSWGHLSRVEHEVARPGFRDELPGLIVAGGRARTLAVGLGRSYGDTCLNAGGKLIDMARLDRMIALDSKGGLVRAEAGLPIDDLLRVIVPKGWFLPTTPGTRFVTLGGAVANDVHGKNHHTAGSFGCSVQAVELLRSDRPPIEIGPDDGDPLFRATVGGLGLTGVISTVTFKMSPIRSSFLAVERLPFGNVKDFFTLDAESRQAFEHTVAWVDCASTNAKLGRGIFQRARWCDDLDLRAHENRPALSVPVDMPGFLLAGRLVRYFNAIYYRLQKWGAARRRIHYAPFFYPLDSIRNWNRLYGAHGFYQYQCVIPMETAREAIKELLLLVARSGMGSTLAVLKTLGCIPSRGMLSFPREGTTLALDFANRGSATLGLLGRLDAIVHQAGGRLYPAKDGRMPAKMFTSGFPQWREFAAHVDPRLSSDFWRRVSREPGS
jgi:FAD/FMN-containing dehydrogenase